MWVELQEEGRLSCSSKVGKGRSWAAMGGQKDEWKLQFFLGDKLDRPMMFVGEVKFEGTRGTGRSISGEMRGPPRRKGASDDELENGVQVGEFAGYQLDN
mmetsp:Transcript_128766/g.248082  ORF Transcript_128766/g.248082 Transcript_128766/m.248082 type:complete len:100 (+) Transcript_128766:3-302(+)